MTAPAAPIRIGHPEVTLRSTALALDPADHDRWRTGLAARSVALISADAWSQCATGDMAARADEHATGDFEPFTAYTVHGCAGFVDEAAYRLEAIQALEDKLDFVVGREVWTGERTGNPSLQSLGVDLGGSGDATNVAAYLIANLTNAAQGGQVWLHVPGLALAHLVANSFVTRSGNRLLTPTGHVVVVSDGYPNAPGTGGPDGAEPAEDGQVWMYATTAVQYGEAEVDLDEINAGVAARQNLYEVYVKRKVLVRFDVELVFAARVNIEELGS